MAQFSTTTSSRSLSLHFSRVSVNPHTGLDSNLDIPPPNLCPLSLSATLNIYHAPTASSLHHAQISRQTPSLLRSFLINPLNIHRLPSSAHANSFRPRLHALALLGRHPRLQSRETPTSTSLRNHKYKNARPLGRELYILHRSTGNPGEREGKGHSDESSESNTCTRLGAGHVKRSSNTKHDRKG